MGSDNPLVWWTVFNAFVIGMLALDLGVLHRKTHEVKFREAVIWVIVCVVLALAFCYGIYAGWFGSYAPEERAQRAKEFLTGYLVEQSLSVDNVFVFAVLLTYFKVPAAYQHRVLFFGILGAIVLRAIMIFAGVWLIHQFEWILYFFAALLIWSGIKLATSKDKQVDPEKNPILRWSRKLIPITDEYDGHKFFVRRAGKLMATPLLLVLIMVETTDVVFALDSIPAILIITRDTFIVYTSNIFAIICLRALYFALAGFMGMFAYLSHGLAFILVFIGGKMFYQIAAKTITGHEHKIPIELSLGVIALVLTICVVASLLWPPADKKGHAAAPSPGDDSAPENA